MALTTCPDCGTEVSDAAPACVKCGRPIAPPPPIARTGPINIINESRMGCVSSGCIVVLVFAALAAIVALVARGCDGLPKPTSRATDTNTPAVEALPSVALTVPSGDVLGTVGCSDKSTAWLWLSKESFEARILLTALGPSTAPLQGARALGAGERVRVIGSVGKEGVSVHVLSGPLTRTEGYLARSCLTEATSR